MLIVDEVRRNFEDEDIGPALNAETLATAERELGHTLPAVLWELYTAFDGFFGPTGAVFLYPLLPGSESNAPSLVGKTLFLRKEDYFPKFWRNSVTFGDDGCGTQWGLRLDSTGEVFEWSPHQGEEYTVVGSSLLDVWLKGKAMYEESGSDA